MRLPLLAATLTLAGCASTPAPLVTAAPPPLELVRPPCEPGADLMVAPPRLPEVRQGERKFERIARDRTAYRDLRALMIALQDYVRTSCR